MIRGLKTRKLGATGRAYSAGGVGHSIKLNVAEHGYKFTVQVEFNYNAMTERQAQKAHGVLYAALTEALAEASERRRSNIPLFELEDLKPDATQGINER